MARKKKRTLTVVTVIILILLLGFTGLWFGVMKGDPTVFVSVEKVTKRTIVQTVNAIGKVQPEFMVTVSSEASGEIVYLGVRDGDTVRKGQLLANIAPDLVQTQLDQMSAAVESSKNAITIAKAEMDRTEADLKRVTELYKKDYATREEMDRAKAAYESAAARYNQSRAEYDRSRGMYRQSAAQASRTTITSPMNGVVTYLAVERGEKVVGTQQMQGTEMMKIADLSVMNAWVDVDENDVALISVGDTARIRIDALPDTTFIGVVYEISHSPKTSMAGTQDEVVNYEVRVRFTAPDKRMRPGMSVSVDIETETKTDVLAVPIQAVTVDRGQLKSDVSDDWRIKDKKEQAKKKDHPQSIVWITDGVTVEPRAVETGISDQGFIEITSGLKEDERIVTAPYQAVSKILEAGMKIKVEDPQDRRKRFDEMRKGS
jgi:HlyD family secretion protein